VTDAVGRIFGVGIDVNDLEVMATFWQAITGYERQPVEGPHAYLVHPRRTEVGLYLHQVPEPRIGKNRFHLEFQVPDLDTATQRVSALGAVIAADHTDGSPDEPDVSFRVFADPEGNLFCLGVL